MAHFKMADLIEAQTALASTLRKCEKIQQRGKLAASQQTLLDRRVRAFQLSLFLIEQEMRKIERQQNAE